MARGYIERHDSYDIPYISDVKGDEDVDYSDAADFARKFEIELITVPGGDHRLSIPGAPEKVLQETLKFFS